ncbi:MAG: hypothetical protein RIR00_2043 [Pseudomonadota bacterium]|jgi:hypothetical protein
MPIHQINAAYHRDEDRIQLRLRMTDGDELRFWLTRASLKSALPQLQAWMAGQGGELAPGAAGPAVADVAPPRQAFQALQREVAAAKADFSRPLEPGLRYPLGEAPVLVLGLSFRDEGPLTHLCLQLQDKRSVTLHLSEQGLPGLLRLLRTTLAQSDWGYLLPASAQAAPPERGSLH